MARPVFYGWNFVCPVCGCMALEGTRACISCGEPFDWREERAADVEGQDGVGNPPV